jgi:hypothetical protein
MWVKHKSDDFTGTMLDAGYWMLDILKVAGNKIQQNPVSRNQYPGSRDITYAFHHNHLNPAKHF